MNSIKDVVISEMAKRDWNPYDLARVSGVSQPTIFRLISGENTNQRVPTVKKIATAFGLTESQIRGFSPIDQSGTETSTERPVTVGLILDFVEKHAGETLALGEKLGIENFRQLAVICKIIKAGENNPFIEDLKEANMMLQELINSFPKNPDDSQP